MMVTFLIIWAIFCLCEYRDFYYPNLKSVSRISKRSPRSQTCHHHKHFNVRYQHRCYPVLSKYYLKFLIWVVFICSTILSHYHKSCPFNILKQSCTIVVVWPDERYIKILAYSFKTPSNDLTTILTSG